MGLVTNYVTETQKFFVEPSDVVAALLPDERVCGSCVELLSLSRVVPARTAWGKETVCTKRVHFSPTNEPFEARYGGQNVIMMTFENSGCGGRGL